MGFSTGAVPDMNTLGDVVTARLGQPMPEITQQMSEAKLFWAWRAQQYKIENRKEIQNNFSILEILRANIARRGPLVMCAKLAMYNTVLYVAYGWVSFHKYFNFADHAERLSWRQQPSGFTEAIWSYIIPVLPPPPTVLSEAVDAWLTVVPAIDSVSASLSAGMFLMLSFRINRATARWWEAHTVQGDLHTDCRALVTSIQMYVKCARSRAELAIHTYAIARGVEFDLCDHPEDAWVSNFAGDSGLLSPLNSLQPLSKGGIGLATEAATTKATVPAVASAEDESVAHRLLLRTPRHRPFFIIDSVSLRLGQLFDTGAVPAGIRAVVQMRQRLEAMTERVGSLQRVASTPEPWSYIKHMRMTVLLWCALLPFALVPPVGAAAIPIASALAFVVIKMDDVSVEIQDPFGLHLSDIDVSSATESLVLSLLALLVQKYKF